VYFPTDEMRLIPTAPLEAGKAGHFAITVRLSGGGIHSQAEALRHGIARALVKNEETLRKTLKHEGFLKRDPRAKERRKPGLKKARKYRSGVSASARLHFGGVGSGEEGLSV